MSHIWGDKRVVMDNAGQNWATVPMSSMSFTALLLITLMYLYCHVAFGDLPHVETHRGNHVFTELTRLLQHKTESWGENWWIKMFEKISINQKPQYWGIKTAFCLTFFSFLLSRNRIYFLFMSETLLNRNCKLNKLLLILLVTKVTCRALIMWRHLSPLFSIDKRKLNWLN